MFYIRKTIEITDPDGNKIQITHSVEIGPTLWARGSKDYQSRCYDNEGTPVFGRHHGNGKFPAGSVMMGGRI